MIKKILMVTKDLLEGRNLRNIFKEKFSKKRYFKFKKMKETESASMTSEVLYEVKKDL